MDQIIKYELIIFWKRQNNNENVLIRVHLECVEYLPLYHVPSSSPIYRFLLILLLLLSFFVVIVIVGVGDDEKEEEDVIIAMFLSYQQVKPRDPWTGI